MIFLFLLNFEVYLHWSSPSWRTIACSWYMITTSTILTITGFCTVLTIASIRAFYIALFSWKKVNYSELVMKDLIIKYFCFLIYLILSNQIIFHYRAILVCKCSLPKADHIELHWDTGTHSHNHRPICQVDKLQKR